jgi:hypothetical protein
MLWKSRWTDDWFLKRVADQPNRARIQDNQILISAHDEIPSQTFSYNCLMISELSVRPRVSEFPRGFPPGFPRISPNLPESPSVSEG